MDFDILSKDNAKIKYIKKLISNGNFRKSENSFILEGFRLCYDALLSNVLIKEVYYAPNVAEKFFDKLQQIIVYAQKAYKVPANVMKSISETKTPQGIVCICEKLDKRFSLDTINNVGKFIILENIQDPANLGTILRTAEALGVNFVIMSNDCCDIYNAKVLRASMGAVFRVNVFFSGALCDDVKKLQARGVKIYASVPDNFARSITKMNLNKFSTVAIVVGNEGNGLTPKLISTCDEKITIPMLGRAESLNAAMAAGILMWEMMRDLRE